MSLSTRMMLMLATALLAYLMLLGGGAMMVVDASTRAQETVERGADRVALAQKAHVQFKVQVQEWKNILIRGADAEDLATYTEQFRNQERDARQTVVALLQSLGPTDAGAEAARGFLEAHERLSKRYDAALADVEADPYNAYAIDLGIRGIDRPASELLDQVVDEVRLAARAELRQTEHNITRAWYSFGAGAVGITLLTFLSIAYAIRRWVSIPAEMAIETTYRLMEGDLDTVIHEPQDAANELSEILAHLDVLRTTLQDARSREAADRAVLQQARDGALSADKAKTAFLSTVSRELQPPAASANDALELLRLTELDASQLKLVELAHRNTHRLTSLVSDLLQLEKAHREEDGIGPLHTRLIDVQQFFNEVAGEWRPKFRAKEIDFISGVSSDMMPRIAVDADRLAEILDALLSNALKFTQDGHVLCTISPSGEAGVAIRISDTGIGMDPSDIQRVFEPFARTKAAMTTGIEGAGLGLTKALAIAKRMGGDLTLSRSSEGGIVALVTLEDVRSSRAEGIGPTWQRRKSRHR